MHMEWGLVKTILALVLWLPGLISNLFVVSSILVQMRLEGSLQTANIVVGCNSLNNLVLEAFTFAMILAIQLKFCPHNGIIVGLFFMWEISSVMQMWGIILICVFYCLKILPAKRSAALWLKGNFSSVAAVLVTVGVAFSLVVSSINVFREKPENGTRPKLNHSILNHCPYIKLTDKLLPVKEVITTLLHVSVFLLMTFSCAALVAHLYSHVRRMRGNQPGVGGTKQQGVAWVALMIFLLAVEFGSCTIARQMLVFLEHDKISVELIFNISVVSLVLCSLIPVTLIAGTSSLRESVISCCTKA